MLALLMDIRFALRTLRKGWWVTAIALISLAIAIGGNATVFSLVNALIFRPLPFESPERLVLFDEDERDQAAGQGLITTSLAAFADISERSRTTNAWAAFRQRNLSLRGSERAEAIAGAAVSVNFFDVLGVSPSRGRVFRPEEGVEGAPRVVILHHDYWINSLEAGADPIGTVLTVDGEPHEVIGVLPEGFDFLIPNVDLWIPLTASPQSESRDQRDVLALGKMSPEATMEQVRAEAEIIASQLEAEYPETQRGWTIEVQNVRYDFPNQQSRMLMVLLQGSVLSVLLIACVNITNLLLARGQERRREIALRAALGAGRGRIIRQLLTESSLLTLAGAVGGIALGWYGTQILANRFAPFFPVSYTPVLDLSVMGFTLGISVVAGLIFGVTPAVQAFRSGHTDALKQGGQRGSAGGGGKRVSRALVVCEIVLSLLALGGGGMMVRSFLQLQNVDAGFDRSRLLTAQLTVPASKYPSDEEALLLLDGVIDEAGGLPGVGAVTLVSALPMGFGTPEDTFRIESGTVDHGENAPSALILYTSPEYRETIDLALLEGRFFAQSDRLDQARVAVISRTLAENHFPDRSPLGERVRVQGESREIVGVVADVRQALFQPPGTAQPGLIYLPAAQTPRRAYFVMARAEGDPRGLADPLRTGLQRLDPDLALAQVFTLEELISQFFVGLETLNVILTGFGLMALLLAALGVYGVLAHAVNRRRREIGVRMAVGAKGREVVGLFAREGLRLGVIGLAIGLLSTLPLSILIRSLLAGVSTVEWNTVFMAGSVLFGVVLLASVISASKAAAVDPVQTLNDE